MNPKYYYKNQKNKWFGIIGIIFLIAFYYPSTIFYLNPSEHLWWLMPTENSVLIFSIFSYLGITLAIISVLMQILKKGYLKIDNKGIYNDFFFSNTKEIKWDEIESIKVIYYNHNTYLGIYLKKNDFGKKRGFDYFAHKFNLLTFGTGHIIHSSILNCSFSDLIDEINNRFPKGIDIEKPKK